MVNRSFGDIWDEDDRVAAAGDIIENTFNKGTDEPDEIVTYLANNALPSNNFKIVLRKNQIGKCFRISLSLSGDKFFLSSHYLNSLYEGFYLTTLYFIFLEEE